MIDGNKEWTCELDICTKERFLDSLDLQIRAFDAYMPVLERYLRVEGDFDAFDYVGQEIDGVVDSFRITPAGLIAAAHRRGHVWVLRYLEHQRKNGWVTSFEDVDADTEKQFRIVETRLRKFENVPYND